MKFLVIISVAAQTATAFIAPPRTFCSSISNTALNLEDRIAEMIDEELIRLNTLDIAQDQRLNAQRQWSRSEPHLPKGFDFEEDLYKHIDPILAAGSSDVVGQSVSGFTGGVDRSKSSGPRRKRDERMAKNDPARYCADRCVATGNCDVLEDMFEMGPEEVVKFCSDCVLSEDEEPCDVPESLFNSADEDDIGYNDNWHLGLRPRTMHP